MSEQPSKRSPPSEPPRPTSMRVAARPATDGAFDVVVIGGGVNGTGVARDLAIRGIRVALFERNDLAFGASGNSSGMIHGGVRYLTSDPNVTRDSCQDSGYIQQIAPFLLFRIPFLMPIASGPKGRIMLELVDAYLRAYDDFQPLKRGKPHTRLTPEEISTLEPGLVGTSAGGLTFDEWGIDGARLCALNALDAHERGSKIFVHTSVEEISRVGGAGPPTYHLATRDTSTGEKRTYQAKYVVNATGAWGPLTAAFGGLHSPRTRVRPGKGIHVVYDRRLSNYAIVSETIDGRQIFLEPWQNMSIIGTTDDDYFGNLDDVIATSEEVRYLVQGIARVFPSVRTSRAIGTYAGVRPTLYEYGKYEDALSREHLIVDHSEDGAPGVFSMLGGKLASYRLFSQEMADRLARDLCPGTRCQTHELPLPGGDRVPDALVLAEGLEIAPMAARRLVYRHGARAEAIGAIHREDSGSKNVICPCEPVTEAEVRYAIREEFATSVADVSRRTRLGLGACGGMRCTVRCAQIVAEELDLPPSVAVEQARDFFRRQARTRLPVLGPEQARQETLHYEMLRSTLGAGK